MMGVREGAMACKMQFNADSAVHQNEIFPLRKLYLFSFHLFAILLLQNQKSSLNNDELAQPTMSNVFANSCAKNYKANLQMREALARDRKLIFKQDSTVIKI